MSRQSGHPANPHDARPRDGDDWSRWAEQHAGQSPALDRDIDRLRERAQQPRPRLCDPAGVESFAQLPAADLRELYTQPEESELDAGRPARCWRNPPVSPAGGDYAADDARRYVGALERVSARYLGSAIYADALHEHVRGQPLRLDPIGHLAPEGAGASRCAAYVTGASWALGGATAMRQVWRQHRPPPPAAGEGFSCYVRPERDLGDDALKDRER